MSFVNLCFNIFLQYFFYWRNAKIETTFIHLLFAALSQKK